MGKKPIIKAVLFDFSQTLANSADGFRSAEKEAQARILDDLNSSRCEELFADAFLPEYRRLRKAFHDETKCSRKALWEAVYQHFGGRADDYGFTSVIGFG